MLNYRQKTSSQLGTAKGWASGQPHTHTLLKIVLNSLLGDQMGHHWAGGMMTQWLLQRTWGSVPRTHMMAYNHLESMAIHIQLFNNIYKSTPILLSCETKIPGNIFFPKAVAIVRVLNAPERPMCGRFGLQLATVLRSGWTFRRWSVMGTLSHWSCALWATRTLLSLCFLESMGWIDLLS